MLLHKNPLNTWYSRVENKLSWFVTTFGISILLSHKQSSKMSVSILTTFSTSSDTKDIWLSSTVYHEEFSPVFSIYISLEKYY